MDYIKSICIFVLCKPNSKTKKQNKMANQELIEQANNMSVEQLKSEIDSTVELYKAATTKVEKVKLAGTFSVLTNVYNQKAKEPYAHTADTAIKPVKVKAEAQAPAAEVAPVEAPVEEVKPVAAEPECETWTIPTPAKVELRKPKSLTVAECEDIWARVKAGERRTEIASQYNVHISTIADVMGGRTAGSKHLPAKANETENQ